MSRNTKAKTAIMELIEASQVAKSQSEIQEQIGDLCNRVTTYRILTRLSEEGSIHKIVDFDGTVKYAQCQRCDHHHDHDHIHFSCSNCGNVQCLEHVVPKFSLPVNFTIEEINFTVKGVCPDCNSSKN